MEDLNAEFFFVTTPNSGNHFGTHVRWLAVILAKIHDCNIRSELSGVT